LPGFFLKKTGGRLPLFVLPEPLAVTWRRGMVAIMP